MKSMRGMKNLVLLLAVLIGAGMLVGAIVWNSGQSGPVTLDASRTCSAIQTGISPFRLRGARLAPATRTT